MYVCIYYDLSSNTFIIEKDSRMNYMMLNKSIELMNEMKSFILLSFATFMNENSRHDNGTWLCYCVL